MRFEIHDGPDAMQARERFLSLLSAAPAEASVELGYAKVDAEKSDVHVSAPRNDESVLAMLVRTALRRPDKYETVAIERRVIRIGKLSVGGWAFGAVEPKLIVVDSSYRPVDPVDDNVEQVRLTSAGLKLDVGLDPDGFRNESGLAFRFLDRPGQQLRMYAGEYAHHPRGPGMDNNRRFFEAHNLPRPGTAEFLAQVDSVIDACIADAQASER